MSTTNVQATRTHSGAFVFTVSAVSALAGLLFGYDTGVISGARLFFQEDFRLSTFWDSAVTSAALLGCLIGAAFSGRLADRFGRRSVLIQVACLFIVGALATALSPGAILLSIGRVVVGIAIGLLFTLPHRSAKSTRWFPTLAAPDAAHTQPGVQPTYPAASPVVVVTPK